MVRTQIQLTEEQAEALRQLATERGSSLAEVVREAVDRMLRQQSGISWQERRQRALRGVGRFASGRRDISASHDTYLEDAYQG